MGRYVVGYNGTGDPGLATGVDNSYFLLELQNTFYYSLGPHDVVYSGNNYTTNNPFKVISSIQESYDPLANELTVELSTSNISVNWLARVGLGSNIILRHGNNNNFTKVFEGQVTSVIQNGGNSDRRIQVKCQSTFRNSRVGRTGSKTINLQPFESKTLTWGTIVWQ
jgi:hypothetical protein